MYPLVNHRLWRLQQSKAMRKTDYDDAQSSFLNQNRLCITINEKELFSKLFSVSGYGFYFVGC